MFPRRYVFFQTVLALLVPFTITVVRESAERGWENTAAEANAHIVWSHKTWANALVFYDGTRKPDGTYEMRKRSEIKLGFPAPPVILHTDETPREN